MEDECLRVPLRGLECRRGGEGVVVLGIPKTPAIAYRGDVRSRPTLISVAGISRLEVIELTGRGHNGVVVVEGALSWPEGTRVTVSAEAASQTKSACPRRVVFPLVPSRRFGSLSLTGKQVSELRREDDVPA